MGLNFNGEIMNTYIETGLTQEEINKRKAQGQVNGVVDPPTKSIGQIIRTNCVTFFNFLNIGLAAACFAVNSWKNSTFALVILANTLIGIIQEIRAKKVIDKLTLVSAPKAHVLRNSSEQEIETSEIVLDDLMLLRAGRQICADGEVVEGECEVNESLVTGESDAVLKKTGDTVLSGSFVVSGTVKAKVIHVGADNFASKITAGAKYLKKPNSEVVRSLTAILKGISICIIPIAIGLMLNSMLRTNQPFDRAVVSTVAGIIGMIPEGLFLLTSVVMAVSVIRLSLHKTLVQEMSCVETLARVDMLCLDKTGTITEGSMLVDEVSVIDENADFERKIREFIFNLTDDNPTFKAIEDKWKIEGEVSKAQRIIPFSSEKKWSGARLSDYSLIFGAPEYVLRESYKDYAEICEQAANKGQRVLVFAQAQADFNDRELPKEVSPVALIFITDKIRDEAPQTLRFFKEQGVGIKIISGDNPVTVSAIAQKVGVIDAEKYVDASTLSLEEIPEAVKKYAVFGRVKPDQKLAMVKALKEQGHTVGMTGDGVNDVLALKEADCSIAMQSGSDAARQVSNLVLLDSNFASMPKVVAEGRRSVNNIQRSSALFLSKTTYAAILAIAFLILPHPYPFEPLQISLVSAAFIGIPSFLLALEPNFDLIRGNFIHNALKRAIPQGIAVGFSALMVTLFSSLMGLDTVSMSTVATYVVGILSLVVVIRTAIPLKAWKVAMLLVISAIFFVGALGLGWIFSTIVPTLDMWILIGAISAGGTLLMTLLPLLTNRIFDKVFGFFSSLRRKKAVAKEK